MDGLEFYAAIHVTELIGAIVAFGKWAPLDKLSEDDKHLAGDAGFAIVAAGAAGTDGFMSTMKRVHVPKKAGSADGPQAVYGKLYMSVSQCLTHQAYDPVRGIMAEHILANCPLGTGDDLLLIGLGSRHRSAS